MTGPRRCLHFGPTAAVRQALARMFEVIDGDADAVHKGDVVVLETVAAPADLPGGNAFSACRAFKDRPGVAVYVVVDAHDAYGRQIARFCLADGSLVWDHDQGLLGLEELAAPQPSGSNRKIDALLARFEGALAGGDEKSQSALQRLLQWERQDSLLTHLQDPETGLFDGPYAVFKLDEEFRRAIRFHLPLTMVLLDIGNVPLPVEDAARRTLLAEVAAVFLNESRDIDVLARFTATTFLFLLPGTPAEGAAVLARRMLANLRARPFGDGVQLRPCAGLVAVPATGIRDRKAMLMVAEACLEAARQGQGDGGLATSWE